MPWNPSSSKDPDVGVTEKGGVVSFKTGVDNTAGQTLIADGIKNNSEFSQPGGHDHAVPGGDYVDRGAYTGPGGSTRRDC